MTKLGKLQTKNAGLTGGRIKNDGAINASLPVHLHQTKDPEIRRRNAGDIKPGLPLIITGGQQRHADFQYNFTEPGKFKKKAAAGTIALDRQAKEAGIRARNTARNAFADNLKFWLPRNFCPDCNEHDRPHEGGAINPVIFTEPIAAWDIKPGDFVLSTWCQRCQTNWNSTPDIAPQEVRLSCLQRRMRGNMMAYIQARLAANDQSIFPNAIMYQEYRKRG